MFGGLWDELQDAIQRISDPFERLADALKELDELLYGDELTPKEYARQKFKNPRNDISRKSRYTYIPKAQKNLPYQRHIY